MSGDIHVLHGIGHILNTDNVKPDIDLEELERKMINGGLIQKVQDPQDKFNDEMKNTARKLGINFNEFSRPQKAPSTISNTSFTPRYKPPPQPEEEDPPENSESEDSEDREEPEDTEESPRRPPSPPPRLSSANANYSGSNYNSNNASLTGGSASYSEPVQVSDFRFGSGYSDRADDLRSRTLEQERRSHINSVNAEMGAITSFSFEREKKEDMKCQMLEEIDSLIFSLQEEDADLSRIPKVDRNSTFEEVEMVLKMLRHKNDRSRYCSFAEEFLMFGAYGLEELFNGERTWFGRYKPDLRGYHTQVNIKLRRMRHDTSTVVGEIMKGYDIGAGARILLELVPNMILYSKMRAQQHNEPGLHSEEEMHQASERIRGL